MARSKEYLVLDDASRNPQYATDPYIAKYQPKSVLCAPILRHGKLAGVMYLENNLTTGAFSADRLEVLKLLSSQSAISIENAILYSDLKNKNEENAQLIQIFEKFVPKQFLKRIAKEGIENIELGKAENTVVTVLFSDIRSFTELSEQMSPQKLLNFLNSYLNRMNRPIHQHNGFIYKFIGDAILALFDRPDGTDADEATDAVQAAIGMREALTLYNQHRENYDYPPVAMGIGIHTGNVVIGTVGSEDRMDSTVLGDTVNLASRLEGLTKKYGATIIISLDTLSLLKDTALLHFRQLDKVKVKGKTKPTDIYEIFDCDPPEIQELKSKTSHFLVAGLYHRRNQDWDKALTAFQKAVDLYPEDPAVQYHIKYCLHLRKNPPPEDWDGAMDLTEK